jgi:hypothetical protein
MTNNNPAVRLTVLMTSPLVDVPADDRGTDCPR